MTAESRVTVTGRVAVVGEYEWDAFELEESRSDWRVSAVASGDRDDMMLELASLSDS